MVSPDYVAERAQQLAIDPTAEGMAAVFDDRDAVALGDLLDLLHRCRQTVGVLH